jgi:cephalosporin-C deacetylase-like acetyl esterase
MHTLSYFDTINFANRVHCRALVGVGLRDEIVPPETVYAIVNHMSPRPDVVELPVSHSQEQEESRWEEFDQRWAAEVARSPSSPSSQ